MDLSRPRREGELGQVGNLHNNNTILCAPDLQEHKPSSIVPHSPSSPCVDLFHRNVAGSLIKVQAPGVQKAVLATFEAADPQLSKLIEDAMRNPRQS